MGTLHYITTYITSACHTQQEQHSEGVLKIKRDKYEDLLINQSINRSIGQSIISMDLHVEQWVHGFWSVSCDEAMGA